MNLYEFVDKSLYRIKDSKEIIDDAVEKKVSDISPTSVSAVSSSSNSGGSSSSSGATSTTAESITSGEIQGDLSILDGFLESKGFVSGSTGWRISANGNAEFNDGVFRGAISGATIDIGGADTSSFHVDANGNLWSGAATYNQSTNPFAVSSAGALRATSGVIGGFTIGATSLYVGTGSTRIQLDTTTGIHLGATAFADAPFRVSPAGALTATNATITGAITATSGSFTGSITATSGLIAGWTIGATSISKSVIVLDSAGDQITVGTNKVIFDTSGITAIAGSIGGWDITSTLLRSATTGIRMELDKDKNRISIFDVTNEKVVMGYLNGLPKHDGTGNWGAGNYGFWARSGDMLSIDGDSEYVSGDWLIQNDASYLVKDSSANTIIRLGTDTGEKGLFIYNTSGTQLAKLISDEIFVGDVSNYLKYTTTNGLEVKGTLYLGGIIKSVNDVADIQGALNEVSAAGGGTVYLEAGTYTLTADITIPSGCTLEGVSRDSVIIDCDGAYAVKIAGTDVYSTGTVTINNGATTLEGSGTTWIAGMVGQYVFLDGLWYEITARTDNDTLTIATYNGVNLAGASYVIATTNFTGKVKKITITGATGSGMVAQYAMEPIIDDVVVYGCGTGIDVDYTTYLKMEVTSVENDVNLDMNYAEGFYVNFSDFSSSTTGAGVVITNSSNATFFNSSSTDNTGDGINITSCSFIAFTSCDVSGNGGKGIEMVSGNSDLQFIAVGTINNTSDGYKLTATTDRVQIVGATITGNGGYGINIAASTCDNNQIIAPAFENNSSGDINDSGISTIIIPDSILELIAGQDLTLGNMVTLNNEEKLVLAYKDYSTGCTTGTMQAGVGENNKLCPLGGNKFVIIDSVSASDSLFATVGEIDYDTKSFLDSEFSSAITTDITYLGGGGNNGFCCHKLDTDKFIVFYIEDADNKILKYKIGTVSGVTITWEAAQTLTTATTNITGMSACQLATDKGVLVYMSSTTTDAQIIVYTVSGTTLTAGTPASLSTDSDANQLIIAKVATDKFMYYSSGTGYCQIGTCVGGTTITLGTAVQVATTPGTSGYPSIISLTTDVAVIFYYQPTGAGYFARCCSISGTVPTFGTEYSNYTNLFTKSIALDSSTFLTTFNNKIIKYTISGTTISFDSVIYNSSRNIIGYPLMLDSGIYISPSMATSLRAYIQGMSYSFLGIAQATISKGDLVKIKTKGKDNNQSGLVPGVVYGVSDGALINFDWSNSLDRLSDLDYKKVLALSATQITLDV